MIFILFYYFKNYRNLFFPLHFSGSLKSFSLASEARWPIKANEHSPATTGAAIELMPMPVQLGSAVGGRAAAAANAGGASFPANPRDFTAAAPNKRAAASSAGNSPLPDL